MSVTVQPLEAVRLHSNAQLRCGFQGTHLQIQYITWTKLFIGGGQSFVYGFDACANENRGYGDLTNRSVLDIAKPTGLRQYRRENKTFSYDSHIVSLKETSGVSGSDTTQMQIGSATLTIMDVRLEDEARYQCLVKTVDGPADTHSQLLTVIALPHAPVMEVSGEVAEGGAINVTCRGFLGRPTGWIDWFYKNTTDEEFIQLPWNQSKTILSHHENGTTSGISSVQLAVTSADAGATWRCEVSSRAMKLWEQKPYAETTLDVMFAVRDGRIVQDTVKNLYYCAAHANPPPTYIWTWVLEDGTNTILSTDQVLDLSTLQRSGTHTFQCLASNQIAGERYTILMETQIQLKAEVTSTSTVPPSLDILAEEATGREGQDGSDSFLWAHDNPRPLQENERREVIPIWDVVISQVGNEIGDHAKESHEDLRHAYTSEDVQYNVLTNRQHENWDSEMKQSIKEQENWDSEMKQSNKEHENWDSEMKQSNKHHENWDSKFEKSNKQHENWDSKLENSNKQHENWDSEMERSSTVSADTRIITVQSVTSTTETPTTTQKTVTSPVRNNNYIKNMENIPFYESDIDKLSPDNYDYYETIDDYTYTKSKVSTDTDYNPNANSNDDNKVKEEVEKEKAQRRKPKPKPKPKTTSAPKEVELPTTPEPTLDYLQIYLRDLLNPRFKGSLLKDMTRAKGRKVPLTSRGYIDLPKLTKNLPFSTKNMLRKRLPMMNKNLRIIKDVLKREHLANMEENARQLPPSLDTFNYEPYDYHDAVIHDKNKALDHEYLGNMRGVFQGDIQRPALFPQPKMTDSGVFKGSAGSQSRLVQEFLPPDYKDPLSKMTLPKNPYNHLLQSVFKNDVPPDISRSNIIPPIPKSIYNEIQAIPKLETGFDMLSGGSMQMKESQFNRDLGSFSNSNVKNVDSILPQNSPPQETKRYYAHERNRNIDNYNSHYDRDNTFTQIPSFTPYSGTLGFGPEGGDSLAEKSGLYEQPHLKNHDSFPSYDQEEQEAEKYGIYEVEVNINPQKYLKQDTKLSANIQKEDSVFNNQRGASKQVVNTNIFSEDNNQTPNGFSSYQAVSKQVAKKESDNFDLNKGFHSNPAITQEELDLLHTEQIIDKIQGKEGQEDIEYADEYERVIRTTNSEFDCASKHTGAFGGGCRAFYRCEAGVTYRVDCKAPHVFNANTEHCDIARNVASPCGEWRDCRSRPNGKYADTARHCRYYYTCFQGMFLGHNQCNPGTIFNEEKQVCDWAAQTPAPCGQDNPAKKTP